ncbi:class I SAM-dependent DNA methyltransferase [Prolixibacteraceae bacterium]|nr:class I SAM-dependent DNA methyltransferase [Prolixibacteraceae bacterium]
MITGAQKSTVDQIWNTFWNGGVSNTLTIVEQLTYLIFLRDLDETETRNSMRQRYQKEFVYTPIFGEGDQDLRWSRLKEMNPTDRFDIFNDSKEGVFPFIRTLGSEKSLFGQYMKDASFAITKATVLDTVMSLLENLDMNDQDTKGDIYEYLLSKLEGGGTAGQFRTPRHIIKMMVAMMAPRVDDRICDPSCGSAGFLVAAKEYVDKHNDATVVTQEDTARHIATDLLHGTEYDATMLRIASMNLYLHGIQEPDIVNVDAVSKENTPSDCYSLILANPPFKGSIDKTTIDTSLTNVCSTAKTELLFLALMLRQLKDGGRCATIVPDGVLFGSSKAHKSIRKEIVENHKLEAVISMPSGVFKPYAGVSTAILVFTKTGTGGTDKVWFYDMTADGKSLDDKRNLLIDEALFSDFELVYKVSAEVQKDLHEKSNIADLVRRFHSLPQADSEEFGRARTAQSFMVPVEEIVENDWDLSINRYKEIVYEEIAYDAPNVIIDRIDDLDAERSQLLNELKEMLR